MTLNSFVALTVATAALAALGLGRLGVWFPAFDFLAQFTAHWLIIAVAAFLALAMSGAALTLIAAAVVAAFLAPPLLSAFYWGEADRPPLARQARFAQLAIADVRHAGAPAKVISPAGAPSFKLLTFNLLSSNRAIEAMIAEIARHDADVVILSEFGPSHAGLRRWLADRYPFAVECSKRWSCTMGLYSRFPLENAQLVDARDDAGPRRVSADVIVAGTSVRVVGAHLLSPLHGPTANFRELDFLARIARDHKGPQVVAGDFNATIFSHALQNFRRQSGLLHMGHLIPSWPLSPVALPQIGIDHVFMSSDFELYDVAAGHPAGSDHLPIAASLRLAR